MPLARGASHKAMSKNYKELGRKHPRMSRKQKVAIILDTARRTTTSRKAKRRLAKKS